MTIQQINSLQELKLFLFFLYQHILKWFIHCMISSEARTLTLGRSEAWCAICFREGELFIATLLTSYATFTSHLYILHRLLSSSTVNSFLKRGLAQQSKNCLLGGFFFLGGPYQYCSIITAYNALTFFFNQTPHIILSVYVYINKVCKAIVRTIKCFLLTRLSVVSAAIKTVSKCYRETAMHSNVHHEGFPMLETPSMNLKILKRCLVTENVHRINH